MTADVRFSIHLLFVTAALLLLLTACAATPPATGAPKLMFDVSRADSPTMLNAFGTQSRKPFLFAYDAVTLNPVRGRMSSEEALRRLLAGTKLGYRITEHGTIVIVDPALLERNDH